MFDHFERILREHSLPKRASNKGVTAWILAFRSDPAKGTLYRFHNPPPIVRHAIDTWGLLMRLQFAVRKGDAEPYGLEQLIVMAMECGRMATEIRILPALEEAKGKIGGRPLKVKPTAQEIEDKLQAYDFQGYTRKSHGAC